MIHERDQATFCEPADSDPRVQYKIDECLAQAIEEDKLKQLIKQTNESLPSLYERSWETTQSSGSFGENENAFRIMQYNILAEGLSSGPDVVTPFPRMVPDDKCFGGFSELPHPEKALDFNTRKYRILEEIVKYDADILTLQECDHFFDFFQPALDSLGYDGAFQAKINSPCKKYGFYSDGVAVFWRRKKFVKVSIKKEARMLGTADVKVTYCIVTLEHIQCKTELVVCTTHLSAKVNQQSEDKRTAQLLYVLKRGHEIAGDRPFILAGDFNTTASAIEVDKQAEGTFQQSNTVIPMCKMWTKPPLASAYPLVSSPNYDDMESTDDQNIDVKFEYTTWKMRKSGEVKRAIDYIWYAKKSFKCHRWLRAPDPAEVEASRFPGLRSPSDHIPILAELSLS
eukprot:m.356003 g.356003  ORF g.356003 m.356003 type:complete len:398 (-) comp20742_c0_seq2:211-1404(-)